MKDPNIVVIGGGTGSFALLNGLKKYTDTITALVGMSDDGGSTGVLRDEYGVLPPGDVRKCLAALSRTPQLRNLFNYRFEDGGLAGHSFGNLFLTTVEKMAGDFTAAVELAGKVLNITGRVLPVTLDNITLVVEESNGRITRGQSLLNDKSYAFETQRPEVRLDPAAHITPEAREAILEADMVVIAPGSLYSSLAAALVVEGVAEALAQSPARKVFACNLVSEHGQTDDFAVHDYVAELERFLGGKISFDYVIYNTHRPPTRLLKRYAEEGRALVPFDTESLKQKRYIAVGDNLMANGSSYTKYIRHDSDKTAEVLLKIARSHGKLRRMNVNKAIIMMAGYGTRRLPITKALEKCMLPVGNRPAVDYKIEDCLRAGITEFILVVGEEFDQVKKYYSQNNLLEDYLEGKGKLDELDQIRAIHKKARFHYVVQDQYQPYGTSTPVWLCRHLIKPGEKFLVLNGDDYMLREDGGSDIVDLIQAAEEAGAQSAMLALEVPEDVVERYGILTVEERDGRLWCKGIQEQPKREEAASNLASPSHFLFDGNIFDAVERNVEQDFDREHRITEAMNDYYIPEGNSLLVVKAKGEFLDFGNTEGWLHANQRIIGSESV